jgi:hypothetical protein
MDATQTVCRLKYLQHQLAHHVLFHARANRCTLWEAVREYQRAGLLS